MATNEERAALERRLAANVEAWRQPCPGDVAICNGPELYGEFETGTHDAGFSNVKPCSCGGSHWLPGVAEPDGTARRIELQDIFAEANSAAHRVSPEASIHDVMDFDALLLTNPDAIFMAQGAQLAEWLESEGALTDALEAQDA